MVISDFNLMGVTISPFKADPKLVVDPNAVLSLPLSLERLKPVSR